MSTVLYHPDNGAEIRVADEALGVYFSQGWRPKDTGASAGRKNPPASRKNDADSTVKES